MKLKPRRQSIVAEVLHSLEREKEREKYKTDGEKKLHEETILFGSLSRRRIFDHGD
jgi:hypothetical protein